MNNEDLAVCLKNDKTDNGNATNSRAVIDTVDCRVLKTIIMVHFI